MRIPARGSHQGVDEVFFDPAKVPVPAFLPGTPECRSELAKYQGRLKALQNRHDDPWIMKWRYE